MSDDRDEWARYLLGQAGVVAEFIEEHADVLATARALGQGLLMMGKPPDLELRPHLMVRAGTMLHIADKDEALYLMRRWSAPWN